MHCSWWQLQGHGGTVPGSDCTGLSRAGFSSVGVALALNPVALMGPTAKITNRDKVCSKNVWLSSMFKSHLECNFILFYLLSVVGSEQLLLFKENKAVPCDFCIWNTEVIQRLVL